MEDANVNNDSVENLAEAFKPEKKSKKKLVSIIVFAIGLATLIAGVIFLLINLLKGPDVQDGEYLVSAKDWVLKDGTNCANDEAEATNCMPSVIWKFTEIGKGTLTTNNHENDYDFIWALEDGKIMIETDWLYTLENEYDYELNQSDGTMTLRSGEDEFKFVAEFETE